MLRQTNRVQSQQGAYGPSVMGRPTKMILVLLLTVLTGLTAGAQSRYNPYAAEEAYYREFNRRTQPIYNGARTIDRATNRIVNYGSRVIRGGGYVRGGYNATRYYVQRNVGLPRRYRY